MMEDGDWGNGCFCRKKKQSEEGERRKKKDRNNEEWRLLKDLFGRISSLDQSARDEERWILRRSRKDGRKREMEWA
ncbi:uncharacterized protein MONOS_6912 [Monocercomonoides exilis]|uniref:uncharacterized protein n=1 Tax=Monocercomonoides exilis TaxID=2049356 RepID=UPI003559668D|nr:hypothetical protein MONOS_6912 [Monocercomonoides exilis]|eukprot:MONOS_6912.1-p1 / transcript=MONOS_6912.1 / gene=MONOS_6912 / organism=Monocercomonoides_exilis_PA203 / gene_product=unspecified product / transcript_product=unspecified product / location=Mono_scaffold00226:79806-80114(+) / protein_length=76 / sequence_SO=supercontig / SO=protein_coding / is_pseudo=false